MADAVKENSVLIGRPVNHGTIRSFRKIGKCGGTAVCTKTTSELGTIDTDSVDL